MSAHSIQRVRVRTAIVGTIAISTVLAAGTHANATASPAEPVDVDTATLGRLVTSAKSFLESRTARLVSEPSIASPSPQLSPGLASSASRTDQFLDQERLMLLRHKQRFVKYDVSILAPHAAQTGDTVQLSFTEHTRLFFDRNVDPEAPETTEQRVERMAVFRSSAAGWELQDVRRASTEQSVPMNDAPGTVTASAPRPVGPAPESGAPDSVDLQLFNYGIDVLSETDQAEDLGPEPTDAGPLSEAPEDGIPIGDDKKSAPAGLSLASGYCYTCMVNYAKKWWWTFNPAYRSFSTDCTNFVSQALRAGGWAYDYGWFKSGNNWWYNSLNQTYTWAAAQNWSYFAPKRTSWLGSVWYAVPSDVLLADWDHDGIFTHAMMVTKRTSTETYITQHTPGFVDRPLHMVLSGNPGTKWKTART